MSWWAVSRSAQDVNRTVRESSYMYELAGCLHIGTIREYFYMYELAG